MGWKDILRPIRDGLRDNLPSKQPQDDPRDRERRREDSLKGFTYFDSFQQLDDWHPDHVHSFQRANTPLLARVAYPAIERQAKVTLIHDFAGNYRDQENVHGSVPDQPSFSCDYLQYIDSFVYFSHKLVCVPPPSWTNTLHRNGVKSLGTFLVEPQSTGISKILERKPSPERGTMEYVLASQLTRIARFYGFDGWLINIEKTFPIADWACQNLEGFLKQLRLSFDDGCVIWYDSLTIKNRMNYQNGLTEQNLLFAQAAGSILTNYVWDAQSATNSKTLALESGLDPTRIVCGIDVWAQNSTDQGRTRVTYPKDVGGGTGTGLGVAKLAELGLGAGIFAPAWPYEHFSSDSKAVERSMWMGETLPEALHCACIPRTQHAIQDYQTYPILKNAQESPAGSETFFYTNFVQAFNLVTGIGDKISANLTAQSISPYVAPLPISHKDGGTKLFGRLESDPSRMMLSMRTLPEEAVQNVTTKLFSLYMPSTKDLIAKVIYRKPKTPPQLRVWLELEGIGIQIPLPSQAQALTVTTKDLQGQSANRLTGLSLRVEGRHTNKSSINDLLLAEILEICIRPKDIRRDHMICNVMLDQLDERHTCLRWNFRDSELQERSPTEDDGLPYSSLTGPFSFFMIEVDGQRIGQAHSLEYVLEGVKEQVEVQITGMGFDGEIICTYTGSLRTQRRSSVDGWQLV